MMVSGLSPQGDRIGKSAGQLREVMTSEGATRSEVIDPMLPRKASKRVLMLPVPQTNTGRRVENTKANERTVVKELNTLSP